MRLFSIVSLMLAILLIAPDSQARAMPEYSPSHENAVVHGYFCII